MDLHSVVPTVDRDVVEEAVRGKKVPQEDMEDIRKEIFLEYGQVPNDDSDDDLSLLSRTPLAPMPRLGELAQDMGFLIMPFKYLSDDYLPFSDLPEHFESVCFNYGLDVHVMCPPDAYDIKSHIQQEQFGDPLFIPREHRAAFQGVQFQMPLLSEMMDRIGELEETVEKIEQRVDNIEAVLEAMEDRLERFGPSRSTNTGFHSSPSVDITDPLMLAIPDENGFQGHRALVGPCWGEGFDEDDIAFLGIEPDPEQAKQISETIAAYEGRGYVEGPSFRSDEASTPNKGLAIRDEKGSSTSNDYGHTSTQHWKFS
jgi:hypothetical protein